MEEILRIDSVGRVLIPKIYRRALDLKPESEVSMSLEGNKIILKNVRPCCKLCGCEENLIYGFAICENCFEKIKLKKASS